MLHRGSIYRHTRSSLKVPISLLVLTLLLFPGSGWCEPRSGIAMHGEALEPQDFANFPYANPDAPKGGRLTLAMRGTFDSLNPLIVKGVSAEGIRDYVYESLLARAYDEPFSLYGLIAESVEVPEDRSFVEFTLNPAAKFSDGTPITVEDVIFSLCVAARPWPPQPPLLLSEGHARREDRGAQGQIHLRRQRRPRDAVDHRLDAGAAAPFDRRGQLREDEPRAAHRQRTLTSSTRSIRARASPTSATRIIGAPTFPSIAAITISMRSASTITATAAACSKPSSLARSALRPEDDPTRWTEGYDFPALRDGRVVKEEFPIAVPAGMSALVFNTRRPLFADPRVREALIKLFDFAWINRTLYHGQYARTESYFDRSELSSHGRAADAREAALLAPFAERRQTGDHGRQLRLARERWVGREPRGAQRGARAASSRPAIGSRAARSSTQATVEPFAFEILATTRAEERLLLTYARALKQVGIDAQIRQVDSAQYQRRKQTYDFDMIQYDWPVSLSPGNEQSFRWGSEAAVTEGSFNYAGVASPGVDAMIKAMLEAKDEASFVAAVRALDRVLLSGDYVIPLFHLPRQWLAYWRGLNGRPRPRFTATSSTPGGWSPRSQRPRARRPLGPDAMTMSSPADKLQRDPELLHHGGFAIAAAELDQLYQSFPAFLDAACFALPDPIVGDRIFAAVRAEAGQPISLDALQRLLREQGVVPYKYPDRLVAVKHDPARCPWRRAAQSAPAEVWCTLRQKNLVKPGHDEPTKRGEKLVAPQLTASRRLASPAPAISTRRRSRSRVPASRSSGVSQSA